MSSDKLDEALRQISTIGDHWDCEDEPEKEMLAQARQQIIDWALECVGPDDDHTYMERKDRATAPVRTRNQLRHEIAAKLKGEM